MARLRPKPASRVDRLHRTLDVPQADRLGNVRQLVAAVRDGIELPATLHELLDVDHRHFLYYRQAAVILGVVEFDARGALRVTSLGSRLLATAEESREERLVFAEAISLARALRPFASFFAGEPVEPEALARRLEVLTGLAGTTAARRAQTLIKWRRYIQGPDAPTAGELALADPAPQIEALVARHNALVKQQMLCWLQELEPAEFEGIVADLLRAMGYEAVERGGPFDEGIDVLAWRVDAWGHRTELAVQAKRYTQPVGRRFVDELLGTCQRRRSSEALLVTTSTFAAQAVEAALGQPHLRLLDGPKFVDLLAAHSVLLGLGKYGELKRLPR